MRMMDLAALKIQSVFRGWWVRDCLQVDHYCAKILQRMVRGWLCKTRYHYNIYRILVLQSFVRMYLARELAIKRLTAVELIQANYRSYSHRRAAGLIDNPYQPKRGLPKSRGTANPMARQHDAATLIQSRWRGYCDRQQYLLTLADVIMVQSLARRLMARRVNISRRTPTQKIGKSYLAVVDGQKPTQQNGSAHREGGKFDSMEATDVLSFWKNREIVCQFLPILFLLLLFLLAIALNGLTMLM